MLGELLFILEIALRRTLIVRGHAQRRRERKHQRKSISNPSHPPARRHKPVLLVYVLDDFQVCAAA